MNEDEVYVLAKKALRDEGWMLLAGQPPSGCDHLPVVEVKDPARDGLGSGGAFKPDLIAHRDGVILICECKPVYSASDEQKVLGIVNNQSRLAELEDELETRNLWRRHEISRPREGFVWRGALAYAGPPTTSALTTILVGTNKVSIVSPPPAVPLAQNKASASS